MTLLLALACASASGSSPKGNNDDDAPAGFVEVECERCDEHGDTYSFCFAMESPAPFVAFEGTAAGWFPLPQEGVNAFLGDGQMVMEPMGVVGGECVAFVAE